MIFLRSNSPFSIYPRWTETLLDTESLLRLLVFRRNTLPYAPINPTSLQNQKCDVTKFPALSSIPL